MNAVIEFLNEHWKDIVLIVTTFWTLIQEIRHHFKK